jgi:hypothetical protein
LDTVSRFFDHHSSKELANEKDCRNCDYSVVVEHAVCCSAAKLLDIGFAPPKNVGLVDGDEIDQRR